MRMVEGASEASIRESTVTCPECGSKRRMTIPEDRCVISYKCGACGKLISSDGCCIFCDYGDVPCTVRV